MKQKCDFKLNVHGKFCHYTRKRKKKAISSIKMTTKTHIPIQSNDDVKMVEYDENCKKISFIPNSKLKLENARNFEKKIP